MKSQPGQNNCKRTCNLCPLICFTGEAQPVTLFKGTFSEVRLCPRVILLESSWFLLSTLLQVPSETVMIVEAHQLAAVAVRHIRVAAHDKEVLVVALRGGFGEIV
jgi:hypothetical protein